jgi:hypothetical protein
VRTILIAALILFTATANAQVYRCPQTYPGKDGPPESLTGASMMYGERPSNGLPFPAGWLTPSDEAAEEGYDLQYGLPENEQSWLICKYGARKRVRGRFHDGHEWGQFMEAGPIQWWMKLAPKVSVCTVQVREVKTRKSTWTVAAVCKA